MADTLAQQREVAEDFAREHLRECAAELLELYSAGVLPDGKVRHLISQCAFAGYSAMGVAESLVKRLALEKVVNPLALSPEAIRVLAGVVEAGRQAALSGRTDNPFGGKNEALRIAYHVGWNLGSEHGLKHFAESDLLTMVEQGTLPAALR